MSDSRRVAEFPPAGASRQLVHMLLMLYAGHRMRNPASNFAGSHHPSSPTASGVPSIFDLRLKDSGGESIAILSVYGLKGAPKGPPILRACRPRFGFCTAESQSRQLLTADSFALLKFCRRFIKSHSLPHPPRVPVSRI